MTGLLWEGQNCSSGSCKVWSTTKGLRGLCACADVCMNLQQAVEDVWGTTGHTEVMGIDYSLSTAAQRPGAVWAGSWQEGQREAVLCLGKQSPETLTL